MKFPGLRRLTLCLLAAAGGFPGPAQAAILTIQQTAQHAFNAGFRGGSLVSAIAAAEAESAYDTDVVNNNLHQTMASGQLLPGPDGRPVVLSLPRPNREKLPLDSIQPLGDGRYGRVVAYCRGVWQFNSRVHQPPVSDAVAFDPAASAVRAWRVSRHGRDWGKWVAMQNGTAWETGRMARARAAALAIDYSVLTGTIPQERAQARVTGGTIRTTPGGTRIRALHFGDTGRVLAGPVKAPITQGPQTSYKLWWQIAWDSGPTGWVSEDLLIRSFALDLQPAAAAYGGYPHNITGVPADTALTWETGANTTTQKLYVGTTPSLGESDLKFTGLINGWQPVSPLQPVTTYYWRVDTISAQGTVLPGPVWYFLTRPPAPATVVLENVTTSPAVLQPGFPVVITCHTRSNTAQPVLVSASLHRPNTAPVTDPAYEVPRFVPAGSGSFTRNFQLPLTTSQGSWTLLVRLVQDYNGNGVIDDFETVITEHRMPVSVAPPGPLVEGFSVSPGTMAPGRPAAISAGITALPGSALTQLRLYRAEGETGPGPYTLVNTVSMGNNASYQAILSDTPPSIRRYWYALQASDNAGRSAPDGPYFRPLSVRVTIGDTVPPVITWQQPGDGAIVASNTLFSGTFTDQDIVESAAFRLDDGSWQPLNTQAWQLYPSAVAGPHRLTLRATDRSGNTAMESRTYYVPGQPGSQDFDEDQLFAGSSDHQPNWMLNLQGNAAITGGRLLAAGSGDSATFSRQKPIPLWAHAAEVSWQCGVEGTSLTWDRNFFSPLLVRLAPGSPGTLQLQAGDTSNFQTLPLTGFNPASTTRLSILLRVSGTTFYVRVASADASPKVLAESLQTMTNLPSTGLLTATFKTGTAADGTGWLDDISFRALRSDQTFAWQQIRALPLTATERPFSVEWSSIPGRLYQIEVLNTATSLWSPTGSQIPATGLLTRHSMLFPRTRSSALLRVRQLLP